MTEETVQRVIEAIDKVKDKRATLTSQIDQLHTLNQQVNGSQDQALTLLHSSFAKISQQILDLLKQRESQLENEIKETAEKDRGALCEVESELQALLETSVNLMGEGKKLLMSDHDTTADNMAAFVKQVNTTELDCDTVIPPPQEVVCIHLDLPSGLDKEVTSLVEDYGTVFGRAPVQITEVLERPGAVLVKWAETEDDQCLDLHEFRLQYSGGVINYQTQDTTTFTDAYQGESGQYLLSRLRCNACYSLRVCGRAEGAKVWSPWSVPYVTSTTIKHYEWSASDDYSVRNDNTICEKSCDSGQVITSGTPSLQCGHTIRFKVLESTTVTPGDGLFITPVQTNQRIQAQPTTQQAILLTTEGKIFVDGEEKVTRFSALTRKSVVTFDTETVQTNKIRVNIVVNDKNVAFDWTVKSPDPGGAGASVPGMLGNMSDSKDSALYFGAQITCSGWTLTVE